MFLNIKARFLLIAQHHSIGLFIEKFRAVFLSACCVYMKAVYLYIMQGFQSAGFYRTLSCETVYTTRLPVTRWVKISLK